MVLFDDIASRERARVVTTRVDSRTLTSLLGWPQDLASHLPAALWLPAEPANEGILLAALAKHWNGFLWGGVGTWFATADRSAAGFAERYAALHPTTVAESNAITPRGRRAHAEWALLEPQAEGLSELVTQVRRAGGAGSGLVILPPSAAPQAWYAPTSALVQRALIAFERPPGLDAFTSNWQTTLPFLAGATSGYAAVIPLDNHPWGGVVVAAGPLLLDALSAALPDDVPGLAEITPGEVVDRAGGLAL